MDSITFEELSEFFKTKLKTASKLLEQRDFMEDDTCIQEYKVVKEDIKQLCITLSILQLNLGKEAEKLEKIQMYNRDMSKLREHLRYMVSNVPERLPKSSKKQDTVEHVPSQGKVSSAYVNSTSSHGPDKQCSASQVSGPAVSETNSGNVYLPAIDYLTVEEFEGAPKYMKGRLVYDQVNKLIDAMNAGFKAKYKLLKMKKSTLNDYNRKLYETYKSQGNKETEGLYFIVDEDIKTHGKTTMDKTAQNIMGILRHCGRVKEVRGGKLTRYAYIDRY
ncbi:spindle and kinetochore-associated protein 1-like isoform X2 [Dreissena polymorpha]|uniref:SKA complex subunit 1 n=2 Tax=Dreissena polymorpha TaxID=45954 RepID=A0A9D4KKI4_DREPO|nr:spindle and kinetochore-associated protein 1-like isoform X2 [Dreissena polymorpha]XP_052283033.1 spindle and kinetochore-associated protein 1-like isoform X2 [Dreissena polymorpha]KAH3841582.1 hypothetical protein DPMN_115049 [Dreissena polymorpha]